MFDKEYSFRGSHADKVNKLRSEIFEKCRFFTKNYELYKVAPIVGFLYGSKADLDKSTDTTAKIFPNELINAKDDLMFNYRLIVLLDKSNEPDFDKRVDRAFRTYGTEETIEDIELFEQYVRGGIDKMYEKLIEGIKSKDDCITNLYNFILEVDERYNQDITSETIAVLCTKAKK